MRALIYARFSTDRQSESSILDQNRVCEEFAAVQGFTVAAHFEDQGISGAAFGNRPGVTAALEAAKTGDVILVADLSRLSRSQDLAPLLTRLHHRGVIVRGVQDGYDSRSATARMQAGMSGIMSEEFRAMISARTRSALESRAKSGRATGGKAYGLTPAFEPVEAEAAIIREIFNRYAQGDSMKGIASDLNLRAVPSPGARWNRSSRRRDGKWLVSTLHSILHNPIYAGRRIWNRSSWAKDPDSGLRARREHPESAWLVSKIPAIIDIATVERVADRLKTHAVVTPGRGQPSKYVLSGLLICAACGGKMVVVGSVSRYVCGSFHHGGLSACANNVTVPRKLAERLILAPVKEALTSPANVARAARRVRDLAAADAAALNRESANPEYVKRARRVAELERLEAEGLLEPEVAAAALARARQELALQPEVVTTAPRRIEIERAAARAEAAYLELVASLETILSATDEPAAREMLQRVVGPIRLAAEGGVLVAYFTDRREMPLEESSLSKLVAGACNAIAEIEPVRLAA